MTHVIGELNFSQAGRPMTAHLSGDLQWSCEDKSFEQMLNDSFGEMHVRTRVTDIHEPVIHGIYQVAERLGAEVKLNGQHLRRRH